MNYEFLAEARDGFWEAALYYESNETGLGVRFRDEIAHVIDHILNVFIFGANVLVAIDVLIVQCFLITSCISFERKPQLLQQLHMGIENRMIGKAE